MVLVGQHDRRPLSAPCESVSGDGAIRGGDEILQLLSLAHRLGVARLDRPDRLVEEQLDDARHDICESGDAARAADDERRKQAVAIATKAQKRRQW